jgi:hypothetical protein
MSPLDGDGSTPPAAVGSEDQGIGIGLEAGEEEAAVAVDPVEQVERVVALMLSGT